MANISEGMIVIRTILINAQGQISTGGAELIELWQQQPESRIWVDSQQPDAELELDILQAFGCHPLAIKDAVRDRHPPKLEEFSDHIFILYRGIAGFDAGLNYTGQSVSFFIGERFLLTRHPQAAQSIDRLMADNGGIYLQRSPAQLALKIMHTSAGIYLDNILVFEERLGDLEDELSEAGSDDHMRELMNYKSRLVKLRRTFNYHKNITDELRTGEYAFFPDDEAMRHVINDLHDRFERLHSLAQMFYELCGDLVDGYISITSHQLNSTMRVLTVITAIFVPLSFMAGLYGMNFDYMPELKFKDGYFILLGCMGLLATGLMWLFRKKRWL
jgi:magnesium transporter